MINLIYEPWGPKLWSPELLLPKSKSFSVSSMARGQQKIQSQQKNAEKAAKAKKGAAMDQKKAAQAALTYVCTVCKVSRRVLP